MLPKETLCNLSPEHLFEFLQQRLREMILERTILERAADPYYDKDLKKRLPDHIISKWNAEEGRFEYKKFNGPPTSIRDYDCTSQMLQERIWESKLDKAYKAFRVD